MKITEHFHLEEFVATSHKEIINELPKELWQAANFTLLSMEVVRKLLGDKAILVSSGYRCPKLNKLVGGSATSSHMRAEAVDFTCPDYGTPYEICQKLIQHKDLLHFDQLIFEGTWVHISFLIPPRIPRLEVLTYNPGGKNKYLPGLKFIPVKEK